MRVLAAIICLLAGLPNLQPARAQTAQASVKLVQGCETPGRAGCPVRLSIEGPITVETGASFMALLQAEQQRSGAGVKPVVSVRSAGGDVNVAMNIGREIRVRAGEVSSPGPCHSACAFLAMGGVERNLAGVGLHRPAFARSDTDVLAEADARYKRMVRLVTGYLFEMNISDAVLRIILATPPNEMRLLAQADARRLGLNGSDPAFEEMRTGQQAALYGLTSAEWRLRTLSLDKQCGRESELRSPAEAHSREECRNRLRESILWGFDEPTLARFKSASAQRCQSLPPESPEARACVRAIADEIRGEANAPGLNPRPAAP